MSLYRRIFQNFESNRLRRHQFAYIAQFKAQEAYYNNNIDFERQFVRSKSDIITHNNQIQRHFDPANDFIDQMPKHNLFAPNDILPFDAIPCADQPPNTSNFSSFIAIAHQFRQLLTAKWDNCFHEEIDEYHRKFGPIFRKTLPPGINGELGIN